MSMQYITKFLILLSFLRASYAESSVTTSTCGKETLSMTYLNIAAEMIKKAEHNFPVCGNLTQRALDCADLLQLGHKKSGVYKISPVNRLTEGKLLDVYCDMETNGGGWTVIQRRGDFQNPSDYFSKDWKSYKEGFGDNEKEFWLGNDNIFVLTNQKFYTVRFDMEDVMKTRVHSEYDMFWIDNENQKYTLHISGYSGDAGDSLISHHNNRSFSTIDQDNDNHGSHCAAKHKGGWWYNACYHSDLNGLYSKSGKANVAPFQGIHWISWKKVEESLIWTEIKIRPKDFSDHSVKTHT